MTPEAIAAKTDKLAKLKQLKALKIQRAEMQAPTPEAKPEATALQKGAHVAGGFNKGLVDVANLPFAASGWLAEKFGQDPETTFDLYDIPAVGEFLTEATAPELEKGESTALDMARTGLEWGGGGVFTAGRNVATKAPAMIEQGTNLLSKLGAKAGSAASAAKTGIAPDVLMGGGAAIGEQLGDETGEVAGGMTGMLASALRGKLPTQLPFSEAKATAKASKQAEDFITQNMVNPDLAKETLRGNLAEGTQGTLLDLTEDIGLTGVEQTGGLTHAGKKAILDTRAAREAQVVEDLQTPFGASTREGAEEAATGLAQARQKAIREAGESRIAARETAATEGLAQTRSQIEAADDVAESVLQRQSDVADVVAPPKATTAASEDAFTGIRESEKAYETAIEAPAWKAFEEGPPVEAFGVKMAVDDIRQKLTPERTQAIESAYGVDLKNIGKWSGDVSPASISDVRSSIKEQISRAESYGKNEKVMDDIVDAIDKHLVNTGNDLYANAVQATRNKHQQFRAGDVGKQRRKAAPEAFLEKLRFGGDQGKVTAQNLKATDTPDVLNEVESYFKAKTKGEVVDDKFLAKYEGFLSEFPELADEFTDLAAANAKSGEATGLSKALSAKYKAQREGFAKEAETALPQTRAKVSKLSDKAKKGVTAQYADKPQKTLKRLLGDADSVKELKTLRNTLDKQGAGASLKGHVRDIVKDKLLTSKTGTATTRANALDELYDMKAQLVDSGIVKAEEFDKMMSAAGRSAKSKELRKTMIDARVGDKSDEGVSLAASAISAAVMQGLSGSSSLVMTGALRRFVKRRLKQSEYSEQAMARVDEFLSNPQSFIDHLSAAEKAELAKIKDGEEAAKAITSKLFGAGQAFADDEE